MAQCVTVRGKEDRAERHWAKACGRPREQEDIGPKPARSSREQEDIGPKPARSSREQEDIGPKPARRSREQENIRPKPARRSHTAAGKEQLHRIVKANSRVIHMQFMCSFSCAVCVFPQETFSTATTSTESATILSRTIPECSTVPGENDDSPG